MNIYCLDTSALIDNPKLILEIGTKNDEIIIPFCVLKELDDKKNTIGLIGKNTRDVLNILDSLRSFGKLQKGVELETGATIKIVTDKRNKTTDDKIIATARSFLKKTKNVYVVSNDIALRIKADSLGLLVIGTEKPDQFSTYTGYREISVDSEFLNDFFIRSPVKLPEDIVSQDIHPNELLIMKNNKQSGLGRVYIDKITSEWMVETIKKCEPWGIAAKNKEQEFALNLLMNKDIHLVSMVGRAGSGKSYIALAAGLQQVVEKKIYEKLIFIRPVVSVGKELGHLPGDLKEKLSPWLQPVKDNLEILFGGKTTQMEMYFEKGILEMEAMSYIRGRSIPNAFIIIDECQNLSLTEIKTVLTRAGEGTKVVLTGDVEQIDKRFLDVTNNGLSIVIDKLKENPISGHITLIKGQRSPLATICADIL